ncbi:MAG: helix-turn-helix domain-containing protein [Prevotellaceae bacterium]|jgi:transcriptional regulator with XRE-family HTH domain|nr:helix-turn-helix domain-containing protein [Prevotellaceae bacterium]
MIKEKICIKIGLKIRELRKEKKISLQQFSDLLNMEYNNIIRIEKGRTNTTITNLYKISQVLGVKLTDLVDVE